MTGNVVPFRACDITSLPVTAEAKVVGGFASDVVVAQVLVKILGVFESLCARQPTAVNHFEIVAVM